MQAAREFEHAEPNLFQAIVEQAPMPSSSLTATEHPGLEPRC